ALAVRVLIDPRSPKLLVGERVAALDQRLLPGVGPRLLPAHARIEADVLDRPAHRDARDGAVVAKRKARRLEALLDLCEQLSLVAPADASLDQPADVL